MKECRPARGHNGGAGHIRAQDCKAHAARQDQSVTIGKGATEKGREARPPLIRFLGFASFASSTAAWVGSSRKLLPDLDTLSASPPKDRRDFVASIATRRPSASPRMVDLVSAQPTGSSLTLEFSNSVHSNEQIRNGYGLGLIYGLGDGAFRSIELRYQSTN